MDNWNVILQCEGASRIKPVCTKYAIPGIVLPAHISIIACDSFADVDSQAVHSEIHSRLSYLYNSSEDCGGPRGLRCMAWDESSCQHILVLLIGKTPVQLSYEGFAQDWLDKSTRSKVIPVLLGGLTHNQVFGNGAYPTLSQCNTASWGGSIARLAEIIMTEALLDEKPGVFLSYLRNEASAGVEQIHDALIRAGFRVFLDRFSGTPGRLFPHELAEAMSGMGLVVLLETNSLFASRWTLWEAAFARRYRIGPVAVNFNGAKGFRSVANRCSFNDDPSYALPSNVVDDIVKYIQAGHLKVAVSRRAYYETLIRLAAQSKGGDVHNSQSGVLKIIDGNNQDKGYALPCGAPGRLKHVRRLVEAATGGSALLAGEHSHLSSSDRSDLEWLASEKQVTLTGSSSIYRMVRNIM